MKQERVYTITTEDAAHYLSTLKHLTFLEPFLAKETTVKQAAQNAQVSVQQMYYNVRKMQQMGLLKIVKTEKRSGQDVHYYRSIADQLFIPLEHTKLVSVKDFFLEAATALVEEQALFQARAVTKSDNHLGFWISYEPQVGSVDYRLASKKQVFSEPQSKNRISGLPIAMSLGRIRLNKSSAEAIIKQILEMISTQEDPEGDFYFFRFAFTQEIES